MDEGGNIECRMANSEEKKGSRELGERAVPDESGGSGNVALSHYDAVLDRIGHVCMMGSFLAASDQQPLEKLG